jgi:hypothetical protein
MHQKKALETAIPYPSGLGDHPILRTAFGGLTGAVIGLAITKAMTRDPFVRDYLKNTGTGAAVGAATAFGAGADWDGIRIKL